MLSSTCCNSVVRSLTVSIVRALAERRSTVPVRSQIPKRVRDVFATRLNVLESESDEDACAAIGWAGAAAGTAEGIDAAIASMWALSELAPNPFVSFCAAYCV